MGDSRHQHSVIFNTVVLGGTPRAGTKKDTVESARSQLTACRNKHMLVRDGPGEDDAKSVLSRSLDIYCQAAMLYNQTMQKPWYRIPGFFMGYRKINEEKTYSLYW